MFTSFCSFSPVVSGIEKVIESPLPGHSSPQLHPEGLGLKWQEFHPGISIAQIIPT